MFLKRIALAGLALGVGLSVAGCTDGYGYNGVSVGYGSGYYDGYGYDGYADPYLGGGFGFPSSYYGWYGDYYYPGSGVYVYDRYRRPYRWNDGQRRYWEGQRHRFGQGHRPGTNWNGFTHRDDYRGDRRPGRDGEPGYRGWQHRSGGWGNRSQGTQPGVVPPVTAVPQGQRQDQARPPAVNGTAARGSGTWGGRSWGGRSWGRSGGWSGRQPSGGGRSWGGGRAGGGRGRR